jgi:hypothetical protein
VSNSDEFNESNSGGFSEDVSSLDDISKSINFNSVLNGKESSGGGNSKSTRHVSSSDGSFGSTLFESKVSFSEEHVISEVKVIFLVESIELGDQEF